MDINHKENEVDKTESKDGKVNEDGLLPLAEQPVLTTCSAGDIGQWLGISIEK